MAATFIELQAVEDYRRTARGLVAHIEAGSLPEFGPDGWRVQITRLGLIVAAEEDPAIRTWASQAVYEEVRSFVGDDPEHDFDHPPPSAIADPLRRLRAEGHEHCPCCRRTIPTRAAMDHWSRMAIEEANRRDIRRLAISHE